MSYEANGKIRYMVRIQLRDASSASIDALLQLRKEGGCAETAAAQAALLENDEASGAGQGPLDVSDEEEEKPEERHKGASNQHTAADDPGSL